ncbi:MAG: PTS sugar transporter subunit IIA [Syntrophobacterales bacterium]|nr:PTS sugar transporter subunit IIA [Syntrophobacterales bacterium]
MKIIDFLDKDCILPDLQATGKREVLEELARPLLPSLPGLSLQEVVHVLMERERLGSTGIGDHIAIPHGKLPEIKGLKLAFGRSWAGVDFQAMDGKPSHLFFLLLAPSNSAGLHLQVLAKISRMLMSASFRESLMQAPTREDLYRLLMEKDREL